MLELRGGNHACNHLYEPSPKAEIGDCSAVNLGLLARLLPDLCDPLDANLPQRCSAASVVARIRNIKELGDMSSLSPEFARFHRVCGIGSNLKGGAEAIIRNTAGLQLESVSTQPVPVAPD